MYQTLREAHDALERWMGTGTYSRAYWTGWTYLAPNGLYNYELRIGSSTLGRPCSCVIPERS